MLQETGGVHSSSDVDENENIYKETSSLIIKDPILDISTDKSVECYEKVIDACGFGLFHYLLLLVAGWALASDSVEVQVVSFVLPSACDLQMTSNQKGWLNAIIFVGMIFGGYIFGGVADIKGRRYVLLWSMTINGLFGLISAFAPTFDWFLLFRFLSGIGVGAAMPIIFSYTVEFMSRKRRGPMIGFLASFWMFGNILTSMFAWLIIPHIELGGRIQNLVFGSWRIFVAVGAFPSLSSALLMLFMPESPMYLQKVGKHEEAQKVFTRIFRRNFGSKLPLPREIKEFGDYHCSLQPSKESNSDGIMMEESGTVMCGLKNFFKATFTTLSKVFKSTQMIFSKKYIYTTLMLLLIWFTLSFGYYGLWMWFPEIFKRVENGGGSTCTGGNINPHNTTRNVSCLQMISQETNSYIESFLVAISNVPGNVLTIIIINRVGRRPLMAAAMILSGISVFFFSLVKNRAGMIAMSCIFSGMSVPGWSVLDMLAIENYPTNLRSTAFGVQSAAGRIAAISGNVVFGAMVDEHCAIPLILVAVLLAIGGLTALKLPKTDDTPLS